MPKVELASCTSSAFLSLSSSVHCLVDHFFLGRRLRPPTVVSIVSHFASLQSRQVPLGHNFHSGFLGIDRIGGLAS